MRVKELKDKFSSFPEKYNTMLNDEYVTKVYVDHTNKIVRLYTDTVKPPEEVVPAARRETGSYADMVDDDGQLILF